MLILSARQEVLGGSSVGRPRVKPVLFVLVVALVAAGLKLVWIQGIRADTLSQNAARQRFMRQTIPAERGEFLDRNGMKLAFSVETRALSWSPKAMRARYAKQGTDFDTRTAQIAAKVKAVLGDQVDEPGLLARMRAADFTYLALDVDPAQEREITKDFPGDIDVESRLRREYPGGELATNVLGSAGWFNDAVHGRTGLEASYDTALAGEAGSVTVDMGKGGVVIPGSERDRRPGRDGADIELTLNADIQYLARQELAEHVARSGARGGSVVVLDARTSEVYALATLQADGNPPVDTPFEPGAVVNVVTAAAAIEHLVADPDDPIPVLAKRIGPNRFAEMLTGLGAGEKTGVGLPGESAGSVPDRGQWSQATFDELSLGRGMSMTALQMTAMYQAIANGGLRVPPRIVRAVIDSDGTRHEEKRPEAVRVVSERTATAVRDMFRADTQNSPAALPGYQISGNTGPNSFVGILPADNPRFVVGVVLDAPGASGPLFRDAASYLAQLFRLPASPEPTP